MLSGPLSGIYSRINNVRLWKKTEFYKAESDHEVIIFAAKGLGEGAGRLLQQAGFLIMGPFPPIIFFHLPMKVLFSPIFT